MRGILKLTLGGGNITDEVLDLLIAPTSGMEAVRSLGLIDTKISSAGLKKLALRKSRLRLEQLSVYNYQNHENGPPLVTDDIIRDFCAPQTSLSELTHLGFSGVGITEQALVLLSNEHSGLKRLEGVSLIGASRISEKAKADFKAARPNVKLVEFAG